MNVWSGEYTKYDLSTEHSGDNKEAEGYIKTFLKVIVCRFVTGLPGFNLFKTL